MDTWDKTVDKEADMEVYILELKKKKKKKIECDVRTADFHKFQLILSVT